MMVAIHNRWRLVAVRCLRSTCLSSMLEVHWSRCDASHCHYCNTLQYSVYFTMHCIFKTMCRFASEELSAWQLHGSLLGLRGPALCSCVCLPRFPAQASFASGCLATASRTRFACELSFEVHVRPAYAVHLPMFLSLLHLYRAKSHQFSNTAEYLRAAS